MITALVLVLLILDVVPVDLGFWRIATAVLFAVVVDSIRALIAIGARKRLISDAVRSAFRGAADEAKRTIESVAAARRN